MCVQRQAQRPIPYARRSRASGARAPTKAAARASTKAARATVEVVVNAHASADSCHRHCRPRRHSSQRPRRFVPAQTTASPRCRPNRSHRRYRRRQYRGGELLKVTLLPTGRARLRGTSAEAGMELRLEPRIGWMVGDVLGGLGSVLSGSCTWCGRSMDISKKSCGVVAGTFAADGRTRGVDCTSVVTPSTRSSRSRAPEKVVGVSGVGAGAHSGARAGAVGGGSLRCSTGCCSLRCRAMVRSTQVSSFSTPSPCSARSSPLSAVHIS